VRASGIGSGRHAIMRPVVRNSVVNVTVNVLFVPMFLLERFTIRERQQEGRQWQRKKGSTKARKNR
jgi:hypothetical protein